MTDEVKDGKAGTPDGSDDSDSWRDVTSSKIILEKGTAEPIGAAPSAPAADASSEVAVARVRGLRVMVVGEDARHIEKIAEALHRLRVKVSVGSPDESGYRTGLSFRPDVVVAQLTRPGQPGWWLFQRFRRHPLLRWVPVLLMKWWDEGPEGAVHVGRVVERIADSLAPIRILEERIFAGRPLADRMETTSALVLAKVFVGARITGTLTVNDSWNIFEVDFEGGSIRSVFRRGVDGEADEGEAAFLQLLMCDSGRWSFRTHDSGQRPRNIRVSVDELLDGAWRLGAALVGPDADAHERSRTGFKLRPALFHDIASTLSGEAREVVEAVGSGASGAELASLLGADADRPGIERAICALLRSGAVLPGPASWRTDEGSLGEKVEGGLRRLLAWVGEDHGAPVDLGEEPGLLRGPTVSGYYKLSKPMEEEVRLGRSDHLVAPGAVRPSMAAQGVLSPRDLIGLGGGRETPVVATADTVLKDSFRDGPALVDSRANRVLTHDSLVPGPGTEHGRGRRQMWVAILLALLLGGLLVAGLVVVGSGGREVPEKVDRR
jgi:hypothetical protein